MKDTEIEDLTCACLFFFNAGDLKQKVSSIDAGKAPSIISQVETLYQTYLVPTSPSYLELDHSEVAKMAAVLSDGASSATEKCEELKRLNVFGRLKGHIYHELLMKVYYPRFLQSYEVRTEFDPLPI